MPRQRKFNKRPGPSAPNPNLIVPTHRPSPPRYIYGVRVTEENEAAILQAACEGNFAGYRYILAERAYNDAARRNWIDRKVESGMALGAALIAWSDLQRGNPS